MRIKIILIAFVGVSITNLVAQLLISQELIQFTKPVLMPLLLFYIYESSKGKVTTTTLLLFLAILLSWFGDISLLYQTETYFMLGIGFFLIAHVCYILILKKATYQKLQFEVFKILPYAVYLVILFSLLLPKVGDLTLPIFIYGIVISVMAGTARLREGNTSNESYQLAFYGSILFLISDSLLAIDKFYVNIPFSGLWVMSTYLAAQYLLVKGILKHVE